MSLDNGNKYLKSGDFDRAIEEYKKIPKSSPAYKFVEFNIRLAKSRKKRKSGHVASLHNSNLEKPKLSIVMPVFNVGPYLDASILSVRYQNYQNFELIIVNDASTDNGKEIIAMHAALDSRIRVINLDHNTLGGAGIPSNIGIDAATGVYLGFVDSDDWVNKDAFEKMVDAAQRHKADLVIGGFRTFVENTRDYSEAYDFKAFDEVPTDELFTARECPNVFRLSPVPWRKLYRRTFLEHNDIRYPEGDYFYEDNPLHWFVLSSHSKIVKINDVISYHRMAREGQTMGAADYKLGALASHINTIGCFLADHVEMPGDQPVVDEFFDYCYRSSWVSQRQEREEVKSIIGKKISQIVEKNQKRAPVAEKRDNFDNRMVEFSQGYKDFDLTIVIPAYNCEEFIEETINSALSTPGINTNVLVIDDGSTDRTAEICQKLAQQNYNLHFFEQKNKGAGRARNAVIPLCTGRYTFFLDADDVIDGEQLAKAVKAAAEAGNDLYFFGYKIAFYEKNQERNMFDPDRKLWEQFSSAKSNDQLRTLVAGLINYPWNRIIQTDLLHDANIFFGPTVVHNDIAYHWDSILAANNIGYSDYVVCTHRKFERRVQITNVADHRRMGAFDSLSFTHAKIARHYNGKHVIDVWGNFSRNLVDWVKGRVPEELLSQYEAKKARFLDQLNSLEEEKAHNV